MNLTSIRKRITPPIIALLIAILLFIGSYIFLPSGAGLPSPWERAANILRISAFLGIIAAGQTLVILSGGEGIDLSVASTVTLCAMVVGAITNKEDTLIIPGLLAALALGAAIGLMNGVGVAFLKVHPLVMTLGVAGVIEGVMQAVYRGVVRGGSGPLMSSFVSHPVVLGLSGAVLAWMVIGVLMWLLLTRTRFGKNLYAVGINRDTAFLSGVRVPRTVVTAYVLSSMLAAFGGFMLLGYTQTVYFTLGEAYLFPSIAAVVIGGTTLAGGEGSYWGTLSGALVLTVLDSILTGIQMPPPARQIILGAILILVITVYGREKALRQ